MAAWGSGLFVQYGSSSNVNWYSSVVIQSNEDLGYIPVIGKWTWPLLCISLLTCAGLSLPHGWNTGALNAPQELIKAFINSSYTDNYGESPSVTLLNLLWSITVASYLFSGMIGAFSVSLLSERFGRRNSILISHAFVYVAAIMFGFAKMANSFIMLILGRIVVGLGCGAGTGLVPMYLTEIAPINLRGAVGTLHQLFLTLGILVTQILGLRQVLGTEDLWPVMLALMAVPSAISTIVLLFFPDSPRYLLINKKNEAQAVRAMKIFRGHDDVTAEIDELRAESRVNEQDTEWSLGRLLSSYNLRWPVILVCSLAVVQQLGGINVIFYYSTSVFEEAGIPSAYTQYATLGTGIINTSMTIFSVWAVEKFGRRSLLIVGMCGMCVTMTIITVALNLSEQFSWMPYISLLCVLFYVISFALGLGSIPQFIGAEMFQQGPRPPAMAFAGMLNWMANFTVGITFPFIQLYLQAYSFVIFLGVVVVFLILIWIKLPETKNKRFEDIAKHFHIKEQVSQTHQELETKANLIGDRLANNREQADVKITNTPATPTNRTASGAAPTGATTKRPLQNGQTDDSKRGAYLAVPRDHRYPPPRLGDDDTP